MARLFVLVKRKGAKKFIGAIPTKKGATRSQIKRSISGKTKKGLITKIVTEQQFKRLMQRRKLTPRSKKRITSKKPRRRKR